MKRFGLCMKYVNRITGVLGALLIFYMICSVLNYMYVEDDGWGRIFWHDFYEDDGKIDNIYLGSSHAYCDLNPALLDKINGQYNFNMASGEQPLNGTYYLLKEADKNNSLSHVYLELYYWCSVKNNFDSDSELINTGYYHNFKNTDYMKLSINKIEYMLSIVGVGKYVDMLFPFSRYRVNLDNWDYIKQITGRKREESYIAYEQMSDWSEHRKQGYYFTTRNLVNVERLYSQNRILGENPIGEESEKYLRKIISYCQKRDIPITLFVSPMDELKLISTENYDNYINQVSEIAEEYDIEFYDFNLAKEEYLPIHSEEYFFDFEHLNGAGGSIFTPFFSKVVSETLLENEKYFYDSYEDKLQSIAPAIYGLYYGDSDGFRTYHVASNRENGMEYRITLISTSNEPGETV